MPDERLTPPLGEPDDRPDDPMGPDAERFERYLDALLSGERPSPDDVADRDEAEMARLAAELSAAADPAGEPNPAFLDQLRLRMRQADQGIASVQEPLPLRPTTSSGRVTISRRQLLQAGVIGAAGVAAGAAGIVLLKPEVADQPPIWDDGTPLVGADGVWADVAAVSDVAAGQAVRFSTPAYDGYVVNDNGEIRALIAVCTHMACSIYFRPDWSDLRCACHNASFDLAGKLANGRDRWRTDGPYPGDAHAYQVELPDLVRPKLKVEDGRVFVWTAKEVPST